jgi:hypothetical protein
MVAPDSVPAHIQAVTHRYSIAYPEHGPREADPHYADFHHYKAQRKASGDWICDFAKEHRGGDQSECDLSKPLECHHKHIEQALLNDVDLALLEPAYPGVSAQGVGAWVQSALNLELLCVWHHRGHAGAHTASYSDYGASFYIPHMIQ